MFLKKRENHKDGLPPRVPPWSDWQQNINRMAAPHNGAANSFNYIFPSQKYNEAYASMGGPGWGAYWSYLNYNHGHQPYDYKDAGFNMSRTPMAEAHIQMPLAKTSPKSSAPGIQQAQQSLSNMLAAKSPIPGIFGAY